MTPEEKAIDEQNYYDYDDEPNIMQQYDALGVTMYFNFWICNFTLDNCVFMFVYLIWFVCVCICQAFKMCMSLKLPRLYNHLIAYELLLDSVCLKWFLCVFVNELNISGKWCVKANYFSDVGVTRDMIVNNKYKCKCDSAPNMCVLNQTLIGCGTISSGRAASSSTAWVWPSASCSRPSSCSARTSPLPTSCSRAPQTSWRRWTLLPRRRYSKCFRCRYNGYWPGSQPSWCLCDCIFIC